MLVDSNLLLTIFEISDVVSGNFIDSYLLLVVWILVLEIFVVVWGNFVDSCLRLEVWTCTVVFFIDVSVSFGIIDFFVSSIISVVLIISGVCGFSFLL